MLCAMTNLYVIEKFVDTIQKFENQIFDIASLIECFFKGGIGLILTIIFCIFPEKIKNVIEELKTSYLRVIGGSIILITLPFYGGVGMCLWACYITTPFIREPLIEAIVLHFHLWVQMVFLAICLISIFLSVIGAFFVLFPESVKRIFSKLSLLAIRIGGSIFCFIISIYILIGGNKITMKFFQVMIAEPVKKLIESAPK